MAPHDGRGAPEEASRAMSIQDHIMGEAASSAARPWSLQQVGLLVAGVVAAGLVLFLTTYNLELYPKTWFDEGSHLHVPKNLVQRGVYADSSAEGFRHFGPTTGVGPTVLLPIAAIFKVAGIGLLQARLVMVAYLLAALALFVLVTRRLYGGATAALAAALLITVPGVNLLYLGRQVLGEVPALAFLLLGALLWLRAAEATRRATGQLALAALAFGLAALTKNQFGLLLAPTFALLMLLDRGYYRQLRPRFFVIPLAGVIGAVALSYLGQLLIAAAATGDAGATLRLMREASGGAIFVFSPARWLASLKFLVSPEVYGYWALPGLLYGAALARERSRRGLQQGLLVGFACVGLAWFAFGSIGWPRYAFPALAVAALFVAKLFVDLVAALTRTTGAATAGRGQAASVGAAALVIGVGLLLAYPLQDELRTVAAASDRSPQTVAAYLTAQVPQAAVIETWEPELGFLTDHRYHYPPLGWLDRAVRARWLGSGAALTGYDPDAEARPAYLVVGPFARYTGIYAPLIASTSPRLIVTIGEYDVYQR
jgi:hypothetical protein